MVEHVLESAGELLCVVAGHGVCHERHIARGDRLYLLVITALDRLLDRRGRRVICESGSAWRRGCGRGGRDQHEH
jgi:hypothetical protein